MLTKSKTQKASVILKLFLVLFTNSLFFLACVSQNITGTIEESHKIIANSNSIQYYSYKNTYPTQKLQYHIVSIQLDDPLLRIISTLPNADNTVTGQTTFDFAKKNGAVIAMNATPFSYPKFSLSSKRTIVGLYINEGKVVSTGIQKYAALCFGKDNKAFIVDSQIDPRIFDAWYAFGGFWTILENDIVYEFKDIKDARTVVGINSDGNKLYVLVVEKNNKSLGLNYMECAEILKNHGAVKAMQLDGGGSSSLILNKNKQDSVVSLRKVAINLGFNVSHE